MGLGFGDREGEVQQIVVEGNEGVRKRHKGLDGEVGNKGDKAKKQKQK